MRATRPRAKRFVRRRRRASCSLRTVRALRRIAAGVAHRLGGCVDTHITATHVAGSIEVSRWFYRQRIEAVITRAARPWILLLDAGTHAAFEGEKGHVVVEQVVVSLPSLRTTVTGMRVPAQDAQTIRPDARMLFVAGAGWTKKQPDGQVHAAQAAGIILNFLHQANASLGSSKSLVDQGGEGNSVLPFLTHMNQVGQTGSTPRHRRVSPPAATAKNLTLSAGDLSANGGLFRSIRTADGHAARLTSYTSPMPSKSWSR